MRVFERQVTSNHTFSDFFVPLYWEITYICSRYSMKETS